MSTFTDKDYYKILGVEKSASTDEIRRAFQKKAVKLHPDVNKAPDAEEQFKALSEAYAVLSDEKKRARYDAMRSGNPFTQASANQAGYGSYSGGYSGGWSDPFGFPFDFGFPFGASTKKQSRAYNPKAGSNIDIVVELSDEQAKEGTKRAFTYQRYVSCESCHGKGSTHSTEGVSCPTCGGRGTLHLDLSSIFGIGTFETTCPECEGTGKVVVEPCSNCGGSGRILSASEYIVDIKKGAHDGDVIEVAGMGNAGTNGKSSGNLNIHIGVASERISPRQQMGFRLLGFDLPFIIFGAMANVLSYMSYFVIALLVIGLFLIGTSRIRFIKKWWENAGQSVLQGAQVGLIWALFLVSMYSCVARGL